MEDGYDQDQIDAAAHALLAVHPTGPLQARVACAFGSILRAAAIEPIEAWQWLPCFIASTHGEGTGAEVRLALVDPDDPSKREVYRFTSSGEVERMPAQVVGTISRGVLN